MLSRYFYVVTEQLANRITVTTVSVPCILTGTRTAVVSTTFPNKMSFVLSRTYVGTIIKKTKQIPSSVLDCYYV